jgi:hypothetical protein
MLNTAQLQFFKFLPVSLFGGVMGLCGLCFAWRLAVVHWHMSHWVPDIIGVVYLPFDSLFHEMLYFPGNRLSGIKASCFYLFFCDFGRMFPINTRRNHIYFTKCRYFYVVFRNRIDGRVRLVRFKDVD